MLTGTRLNARVRLKLERRAELRPCWLLATRAVRIGGVLRRAEQVAAGAVGGSELDHGRFLGGAAV